MAVAMSQTSQLSRYRPAVIAVTGLAAAYATWTLWTAFSERPAGGKALHRSNAVHRRRQRQPEVAIRLHTASSIYGTVTITANNGYESTLDIGVVPIPSAAKLQEDFYCDGGQLRRELLSSAILGILVRARNEHDADEEQLRQRLATNGLDGLADAVATLEDVELLKVYQSNISSMLGGNVPWSILDTEFRRAHQRIRRSDGPPVSQAADGVMEIAETEEQLSGGDEPEPSQGLKGLLYYIAEETAKRNAYEHRGISCEECNECPIRHIRYHCLNCPDFDLCPTCEATTAHPKTHLFVKIKVPLPVLPQQMKPMDVWYPGDPQQVHRSISPLLRKRLAEQHSYEEPQIDALYDQFACIANVAFDADPSGIKAAINRRAFDKALSCESWTNRNAPNALYDRMFAFYDMQGRGAILFDDFVSGIAYLRGPNRMGSLHRALRGFDFDSDMLIDRSDFLRMFRAKYAITRQITLDATNAHNDGITNNAMDILRSSQPISSVFQEDIPLGEHRVPAGKWRNELGDMEPVNDSRTILEDGDDVSDGGHRSSGNVLRVRSLSHLGQQLSRLDDVLSGAATHNDGAPQNPSSEQHDPAASALSNEEQAALGLTGTKITSEPSVDRDIFWQFLDQSFNEMLNPLFRAKEDLHKEVIKTRDERRERRQAIDDMLREKKALEEKLRADAMIDPLVATALDSNEQPQEPAPTPVPQPQDVGSYMRDGMVPTDSESLEKFEAEIHNQDLDELLSSSGYSLAEPAAEEPLMIRTEPEASPAVNGPRRTRVTILAPVTFSEPTADPTLPQHRPDSISAEATSRSEDPVEQSQGNGHTVEPFPAPTQARLEYLASLDEEEKLLESRGAPGRMTFDEVEGIVDADSTKELKGLVTSWLEWASF